MGAARLGATLAALLVLAAPARAAVWRLGVERRVEASDCGGAVASFRHTLLAEAVAGGQRWVDLDASHWDLGSPVAYAGSGARLLARERFRLFDGAIVVEADLRPAEGRFAVRLSAEPGETFGSALAHLLPGLALPCRASGTLLVRREGPDVRDPARAVRLYAGLQEAADALLHGEPARARAALDRARELEPGSGLVRWMQARAEFSEALGLAAEGERRAGLERAERLAEEAIALDPRSGEAHLWRAAAGGRLAAARGGLRTLASSLGGDGGPAAVARSFERAIELEPAYAYLGDSLHADALFGAARLYRRLPEGGLARALLGVGGDLDRAVELSRRALARAPGRIEYAAELGAGLLCRGSRRASTRDLAEGRRVLEGALALHAFSSLERRERRAARRLLDDPAGACGWAGSDADGGTPAPGDEVAAARGRSRAD